MAGTLTSPPKLSADSAGVSRSHLWGRRIALVSAGVLIFMLTAWILSDPVENLSTDWTAFDAAADRVFAGEDVYRPYDAETEPLPYLYPPFALWLALPLGLFGFAGSFFLSALFTACCLVFGLVWMSRAERAEVDRSTGLVVGLASGAAISSTLIGQYSGVYALAVGGAAHAYSNDRKSAAGAFLALLWLKPNLAIAVPVVLLWSRSWPVLRGFSIASTVIVLASLPFGLERWSGFFSNVEMMAQLQEDGVVPFRKMVTVLGSVQTVFPMESISPVVIGIWLISTAIMGVSVLELWRRSALDASPVRAFGALALFLVAANPRLYFYDSTLVVVGMLGVWLHAQSSGSERYRRLISGLAVATWFVLWGGIFVSLNALVGPIAGLTLVMVAVDQRFPRVFEGQPALTNGPTDL
jgi:hypothetical protein